MTTYWGCTCGASGEVTTAFKTDSANDDAKHQADCKGSVVTSTSTALLDRVAGRLS